MKKRNQIQVLLVLVFLLGMFPKLTHAQEFGLQLYSLRNQFKDDIPGTLKFIKDCGITEIEGGDSYGMPLEEFKTLLKKNELNVVSIGASYEELRDTPKMVIEKAKAYGARYVMCAWIPHKGDDFSFEDTYNAVAVFNKAGAFMKAAGITFVYHPHGYEFRSFKEGTLFDYMVENARNFAFEMDVYWIKHGGADPMDLLNKYPKKFVLMHLKDMAEGVKGDNTGHSDVNTNVILGTGTIDIAALVKRGKELGIKYMFIEDESDSSVSQIPQSLKFLNSLQAE